MNFYGTDKYNNIISDKENRIYSKCDLLSPTKNIKLDDTYSVNYYYFEDKEDNKQEYASNLRGSVCRLYKENKMIFEWKNIYGMPRMRKIIEHSNGQKYFIFDEDLYGYSVLDLTTFECIHYIPSESYDEEHFVDTFIWCDVHYNETNNYLAVEGCIWGDVYSIIVIDFSNPMNIIETNKWTNIRNNDYDIEFKKWTGNKLEYYIPEIGIKETQIIDLN